MHIAKKIGLVILTPIFTFLLFATAFDWGFVHTATHPANVKKLVADSGVYNNLISAALDQAQQNSGGGQGVSLAEPAVKSAAQQVFTPQFLQNSTNNIIDGVYHWLDGSVDKPDFKIDLSTQKAQFADLVAQHAGQVAAGLPACSPADSQALLSQGDNFDPFSAQCLPKGLSPDTVAANLKQNLLTNKDFLNKAVITADSLKAPANNCLSSQPNCQSGQNQNQKPFFQTDSAKKVPGLYQKIKKTPIILAVLTILFGTAIVFLYKTWQIGLRHVGITVAIIGLFFLVFAWALNDIAIKKLVPKIQMDNAVIQTDVRRLATDLIQLVDKNYWFFGGLYTIVGAGAIVGSEWYRRKHVPAPAKAPAVDGVAKPEAYKTKPEPPKPKK